MTSHKEMFNQATFAKEIVTEIEQCRELLQANLHTNNNLEMMNELVLRMDAMLVSAWDLTKSLNKVRDNSS